MNSTDPFGSPQILLRLTSSHSMNTVWIGEMMACCERKLMTASFKLSAIVPSTMRYNERKTLEKCVDRVFEFSDSGLTCEIIIVGDGSRDQSLKIATALAGTHEGRRRPQLW